MRSVTPGRRGELLITSCAFALLFVFGALEGLIGCFQYSRMLGSVPALALAFAAGIFVTCVLAAWGTRAPAGGLMPAAGWFITSFVLAMATPGGSVVITNTAAGKWFLYGGAACAAGGVVVAFAVMSRSRPTMPGR